MQAKVKTAFSGRPDADCLTREIAEGEIITGELAEVAVREGWADEIKEKAAPKKATSED